jgi:hypothetical protein
MYNARNCDYHLSVNLDIDPKNWNLSSNSYISDLWVPIKDDKQDFEFALTSSTQGCSPFIANGTLESGKANSFLLTGSGAEPSVILFEDDADKSRQGKPIVRVLANVGANTKISLRNKDGIEFEDTRDNINRTDIAIGDYDILIGGNVVSSGHSFKTGGVFAILAYEKSANSYVSVVISTFKKNINNIF